MKTTATSTPEKAEYKGAMRLPTEEHERVLELSKLTHRSLNDLVVEALDFLCVLANDDKLEAPMPEAVVAARALRAHKERPQKLRLTDRRK